MKKTLRTSIWETVKFVGRSALLVGAPAVITELAQSKPEWGFWLGVAAMVVDKFVHENKDIKAKGLIPF